MMHYRTISCRLSWEDLDFPNSGIKKKFLDRAKADHEAGVEMVMIFGFHFRWDFLCCFETVHALVKFIADAYHTYGIKVMEHHSAVLTHRPRNWDGREHTFQYNHHHVPFTPDREVAARLSYNGSLINSWREIRVDDNTPVFVDCYQAENYCPNNPDFQKAYQAYVTRLFQETGVDGLMCDDVCRYAHWAACGCEHCRSSFRQLTGRALPGANDWEFWGNFDNPDFRCWVEFRYTVGRDFLAGVRRAMPPGTLLTTCCSKSSRKNSDADALDLAIWQPAINAVMLEMCGNITGTGPRSMIQRVPDVMLHHTIGRTLHGPVLGMGHAYYPDEAFLVWSFNRFFNNDVWIGSHKARLGVDYEEQKKLPDEAEMAKEAYLYEKRHQELFEVDDLTPLGVYYSPASRSFNGDSWEDYVTGFHDTIRALYSSDQPFAVTPMVPDPKQIPFLLLTDCDCLSDGELAALENYRANGGTLLISGLFGNRDAHGALRKTPALTIYGLSQQLPEVARELPAKQRFFDQFGWGEIHRDIPPEVAFSGKLSPKCEGFHLLAERLWWTPLRAHDAANREKIIAAIITRIPEAPLQVKTPKQLRYRLYKAKNDGYVIHFMPTDLTSVPHEYLRFQGKGDPVIREVHYTELTGTIELKGDFQQATLFTPDKTEPISLPVNQGQTTIRLDGLKRFFSIRIF